MNETLCGSVRVEGFICLSEWPEVSEVQGTCQEDELLRVIFGTG